MKNWIVILFLSLGIAVNAQHVIHEGTAYEVKGKSIFSNGADITHTLHKDKKDYIFKTHKNHVKANKKEEKAIKKQDKAQKKAEKELKKKGKALSKFNKASQKMEQNQVKYNKLKERGKLSPNDDVKWLKKLDGLKKNVEKSRKSL